MEEACEILYPIKPVDAQYILPAEVQYATCISQWSEHAIRRWVAAQESVNFMVWRTVDGGTETTAFALGKRQPAHNNRQDGKDLVSFAHVTWKNPDALLSLLRRLRIAILEHDPDYDNIDAIVLPLRMETRQLIHICMQASRMGYFVEMEDEDRATLTFREEWIEQSERTPWFPPPTATEILVRRAYCVIANALRNVMHSFVH